MNNSIIHLFLFFVVVVVVVVCPAVTVITKINLSDVAVILIVDNVMP